MERRSWPREPVDIAAMFATAGLQSQACRLRDYCAGGVLFEATTEAAELLSVGDRVSISFLSSVPTAAARVELQGEVKRIAGKLIGMQFETTLDDATQGQFDAEASCYRESLSTGAATATTGFKRDSVVATLISSFDAWWPALYQQLMGQLDSSLLVAAGAAQSDREIEACFQSINILKAGSSDFSQSVRSAFLCQVYVPAPLDLRPCEPGKNLAPVDKDGFDAWLLVSSAAARIESAHRDMLSRVCSGLCEVYGLCLDAENYPAGPRVLTQLFAGAYSASFTSAKVRALLFNEFERSVSATFADFLHPLLDTLERAGIADGARQRSQLPAREPGVPGRQQGKNQVAADDSDAQTVAAESGFQAGASIEGADDLNALNTLNHLRQLPPSGQGVAGPSPVALDQLLADLDAAAADPEQALAFESTLAGWIAGRLQSHYPEAHCLTPEQRLLVDLTDSVFEPVSTHRNLSPALRPAMQKLRLPLLKAMLKDASLLADRKHPVRELVNQLACLSCGGGPGSGGLQKTIDSFVEQMLANPDCNIASFESILRQVNALVDKQNQAFLRNLQRVQMACQGQQKLAFARSEVNRELLRLTGGRKVASVFKHLLDFGWRKLLVLVLLEQGSDSDAWKTYTAALGQLHGLLRSRKRSSNGSDSRDWQARVQVVIEVLQLGIREGGPRTFAGYGGVDELNLLLLNQLEAATAAALLQLDHLEPAVPAVDEAAENWQETGKSSAIRRKMWLRQLQDMEIGAGLLLAPGAPSEQRLMLAWRADDLSRLVFVDERGKESKTLLLQELVSQLMSRGVVFIPRQEMPAFDRGVLGMIQSVYSAFKISCRDPAPVAAKSASAIKTGKSLEEWSTRIGGLLENNGFSLRIQKIAALGLGDDPQHHEILLSVVTDGEPRPVPPELIEAAQLDGQMPSIDRWVVRASLRWMAENPRALTKIGGLAVNVSGYSLNEEGFLHFVLEEIVTSGVDTSRLCFEITEISAIDELALTGSFIEEVKQLGCRFALDDVAAGMSSYADLKALPVDYLKIDGSFIRELAGSAAGYAMLKSVNDIGHFLGIKTIAEFVDSDNIASILSEIGIDYAQGNSIERPYYLSGVCA